MPTGVLAMRVLLLPMHRAAGPNSSAAGHAARGHLVPDWRQQPCLGRMLPPK
jgi:hypothetical protein